MKAGLLKLGTLILWARSLKQDIKVLIIKGKTTPRFGDSPEVLTGIIIVVIPMAEIYYSKRVQSQIREGKRCMK